MKTLHSVKSNDPRVSQFCQVTGAPVKDAVKFITKYKRVDIAIDAFYNDPTAIAAATQAKSKSQQAAQVTLTKLNDLFDSYKEQDGDEIGISGTLKFCEDLLVDPEDVVMLAIAYELKSPGVCVWVRKGWTDGWKALQCDNILSMREAAIKLKQKLSSDPSYFTKVYNYTFDFAKSEGQRSLAIDTARAFWALLLPHGLSGGALSHHLKASDDEEDQPMEDGDEEGWRPEYTELWFDFLDQKGGKGISKDTWMMLPDFITSIDSKFDRHDDTAAWPSLIDDFVHYVREKNFIY